MTFPSEEIERLEADCTEAETAFANKPGALWTERTYLSPKSAKALRVLIAFARERSAPHPKPRPLQPR